MPKKFDEKTISHAKHMTVLNIQEADPSAPVKILRDSYNHSSMLSTSLYFSIASDGTLTKSKKQSDDQVVSGYNYQGLPFLIVVDGYFGEMEIAKLFPFINSHITPLVDLYIAELQAQQDKEKVSREFIRKIFQLRNKHCPAQFTLSLAVTYQGEQSKRMYAAGFGVGDCGIILRDKNGTIKQLVHNQLADGAKDGFDKFCSSAKRNEQVVLRSDIFHTEIEHGDELLGYTHLPNGMESEAKQDAHHASLKITQFAVNPIALSSAPKSGHIIGDSTDEKRQTSNATSLAPLLDTVWSASMEQHAKNISAAKPNTKTGDDASLVSVKIPTENIQNTIKTDFDKQQTLFSKIADIAEQYQGTKCCCSFFRNENRVYQLQFMDDLSDTQPSLKVMQGALLLVLFNIQHTQYAFTARGSDLRSIIIDILKQSGIQFKKDPDQLAYPEDLKAAESSYDLLNNHLQMHPNLKKLNWVKNACEEMTQYFQQSAKPADPLQRLSFK